MSPAPTSSSWCWTTASEVVLTLTEGDADNLFDWLTTSDEVYYDLDREVLIFGAKTI